MLSVRTAIGSVLGAIAVLLAILLTLTTLQLRAADDRADAEANRTVSIALGEGLRQSSNDLTRMVRLYVSTGEERYREHYEEILAIRDGTSPRPVDYDNAYWDRVVAGTEGEVTYGPPRSLLDLLRDADFAPAEFAALEDGKEASDELAELELSVMADLEATVELPVDDDEATVVQPLLRRLEDDRYHAAKDTIMASIQDMVDLVDARTGDEVARQQDRADRLLALQLAVIGAMAVVSIGALILANRRVVRPLRHLTAVTGEIAAGDYGQRVEVRSLRELDDLGDRFNEMGEAIQHDVARREAAEREAVEARRVAEAADEAKSQFLASMSHEIRTPLNAVLGMSEILRDSPLDADQRDCVDTITTSGDHLLGVINDILDFSKIESGMLELDELQFDLRRCLEDALDVAGPKAAEKRLDLVLDVAEGTPEVVRSDRGRVRQILLNYLSNAIKFTERGEVLVEVRADPPDAGHVRTFHVSVRDTGIGIPPERLDRLFRSFSQVDATTTRRYGGTGLGLAISKRLAELLGGGVAVESHPGFGSIFSFSFRAEADPSWTPAARIDTSGLVGRRMLVVDDNDTNRRILRSAAESWGMVVVDRARAAEALEVLDAETFDIAVLDFLMPEMDGIELAAAIRARPVRGDRRLPMLLLSSVRRTTRSVTDVDLVMTKPVRRAALLDAIVELLAADELPRGQRTASRAGEMPLGDGSDPVSPLRILLAEDNLANQKVALRMLRSLGYEADIVPDGKAAVDAVEGDRYDLVLMDVHMPEMDGLEATRRIRRLPEDRQPRIFAMTASALDSERQECIDAGMERHLAKPITRAELAEALAGVAAGAGALEVPPLPSTATAAAPGDGGGDDQLTLDELAESLSAEGVVEMIDAIADDLDAALATLRTAAAEGDAVRLRRQAHTMKSNTAMVGAMALSDRCAEVEALAKAEALAEAAPQADALATDYAALVARLLEERARFDPGP